MYRTLREILEKTDSEIEEMGKKAGTYVLDTYPWKSVVHKTVNVYKKLRQDKKKAAMLNKILAEETVIVCEGKNKFPSPILPKDWYIKAKFTDKTTKEITHYVIWMAKGKEEIIKILKKHLPEQTKMAI